MQLDSSAIYILANELKSELIYSQVRKIHQLDNRTMIIELFKPSSSPKKLIISSYNPPLIYMVQEELNLKYTPAQNFCMSLRKHLEGSKITDLSQINLDRVIKINFSRIEAASEIKNKSLYIELIPSAPNIILTENNLILDACLKGNKKNRLILSQESYKLPGSQNRMDFTKFTKLELLEIFQYNKNSIDTPKDIIFKLFNGFSELLINELFTNKPFFFINKMNELSEKEIVEIVDILINFRSILEKSTKINLYEKNKKYILSPIKLSEFENEPSKTTVNSSILNYLNNYKQPTSAISIEFKKEIQLLLKKEERKLKKIINELKETDKLETYKLWGNLLTIHAYENIKHKEFIVIENIFDESQRKIKIPLIKEKSLSENSQIYFKKYNKMKTRIQIGNQKLEKCKENIESLKDILYFSTIISNEEDLNILKKELLALNIKKINPSKINKQKHQKMHINKFLNITIDGFKVFIGKNSKENEQITFKEATNEDIWLHAKKIPGSHVIIKTQNQIVPLLTIEKTASIAAFYSSGRESTKLTVDYTFVKNVKKIPGAKPGKVTYTNEKSLVVIPRPYKYFIDVKT